jgi:hypothetical protein
MPKKGQKMHSSKGPKKREKEIDLAIVSHPGLAIHIKKRILRQKKTYEN